jgi:RNA polymerase sigma-70 factor (ECF subfamily)
VLDRETLAPALARLTDEQRQAVELRFLQGMSVAETAAAMGRSEEAVKKLQARALVNLRRHLTPAAAPRRMAVAA